MSDPAPIVKRRAEGSDSAPHRRAEEIALGLLGLWPMPRDLFEAAATWERSGHHSTIGQEAIMTALDTVVPPRRVSVDQVECQGQTSSVTGRLTQADGSQVLFWHVLRFSGTGDAPLAQIVSVERRVQESGQGAAYASPVTDFCHAKIASSSA